MNDTNPEKKITPPEAFLESDPPKKQEDTPPPQNPAPAAAPPGAQAAKPEPGSVPTSAEGAPKADIPPSAEPVQAASGSDAPQPASKWNVLAHIAVLGFRMFFLVRVFFTLLISLVGPYSLLVGWGSIASAAAVLFEVDIRAEFWILLYSIVCVVSFLMVWKYLLFACMVIRHRRGRIFYLLRVHHFALATTLAFYGPILFLSLAWMVYEGQKIVQGEFLRSDLYSAVPWWGWFVPIVIDLLFLSVFLIVTEPTPEEKEEALHGPPINPYDFDPEMIAKLKKERNRA